MAIKLSTTARSDRMTALKDLIGTSAKLRLYSGTRPANVAASITGTLLAEFTCNASQFGTVSSGVLTASAIGSTTGESGAGAGTDATHYRIFKSDGTTAVLDGDVGESATDLVLDNSNIASGQTVNITSLTYTDGNA